MPEPGVELTFSEAALVLSEMGQTIQVRARGSDWWVIIETLPQLRELEPHIQTLWTPNVTNKVDLMKRLVPNAA